MMSSCTTKALEMPLLHKEVTSFFMRTLAPIVGPNKIYLGLKFRTWREPEAKSNQKSHKTMTKEKGAKENCQWVKELPKRDNLHLESKRKGVRTLLPLHTETR
jgi:hypothetical protein